MKVNLISDVRPYAVSVVKRGANRKQFYLRKQDGAVLDEKPAGEATELEELSHTGIVLHKADWSAVYCVVAEPGWQENCGMHGDQEVPDEWASPDEIRKAAHYFMKSGALINRMHEDLEPYGALVENFLAQTDMQVNGEIIKAGSWVIGLEPTPEGRELIESGEFTGVSLQGTGIRKLVEKADPHAQGTKGTDRAPSSTYKTCSNCGSKLKKGAGSCPNCKATLSKAVTHEPTIGSKGKGLWGMKGKQLPAKMQRVYNDLVQGGEPIGQATYRKAVGIVENWAEGHDGKGNKVSAKVQAEAAKAVAEWNKLRAEAKANNIKKGTPMNKLLAAMAKAVGIDPDAPEFADDPLEDLTDEEVDELAKASSAGGPTFAQIVGRRELSDELPDAIDALRESIYNAFYPFSTADGEPTPAEVRSSLEQSLSEFGDYMLTLYDGIAGGSIAKSDEVLSGELATLCPDADHEEPQVITDEQFADLEKKVDTLVSGLEPVIAKAQADADAAKQPTAEELAAKLDKLSTDMEATRSDLAKLGAGGTTTDADALLKGDESTLTPEQKFAKAIL